MSALHLLAREAGIQIHWRDVSGTDHIVTDATLRAILDALGFPAESESQVADSLGLLRAESQRHSRPLVTATLGDPIHLPGLPGRYHIALESGGTVEGIAQANANGIALRPVHETGYHRLEMSDITTTLAVAPRRAYTIEDAAGQTEKRQTQKLWGLAVQLYALRRKHDGGIGDFRALAEFSRRAAEVGADAIAISPVHAQFSANVTRFSPYAPSNRAALNILHIAQDSAEDNAAPDHETLVNWPLSATEKLKSLRQAFAQFHDHEGLNKFRAESGIGLERHAIFEALASHLTQHNAEAQDWRQWPADYRHPENPAVSRFMQENPQEIAFHAWAQYRADAGLAAAQRAAREAGAKIGLIADLAVGTDAAGSASWCRPDEVLKGLELGAPPDFFNRGGQKWGITGFSPRGLRNSGFAAFIDMLRHALRHAGGVRIDHVMGLARLWVVPSSFPSAEGAYLSMPAADLMRLVTLESQRRQAVILGEDLGTLPQGFGPQLNEAGIAGLRVLWFEREGRGFKPPRDWTPTAVAMTTTHDLPTIAGWWESRDIAWRHELHMQGDSEEARQADRAALWSALRNPAPPPRHSPPLRMARPSPIPPPPISAAPPAPWRCCPSRMPSRSPSNPTFPARSTNTPTGAAACRAMPKPFSRGRISRRAWPSSPPRAAAGIKRPSPRRMFFDFS